MIYGAIRPGNMALFAHLRNDKDAVYAALTTLIVANDERLFCKEGKKEEKVERKLAFVSLVR